MGGRSECCCFRLISLGAPTMCLGSFMFVWLVRVRPGCHWVRSGSSGSSGCALCVAGFVGVRMDSSGAPLWSSGSFLFVWYFRVRPGGRWGSSVSSGCALGLAWFVRVSPEGRWVLSPRSSGACFCAPGVSGLVWVCLVCSGAPMGSLDSLGFVWFVWVL